MFDLCNDVDKYKGVPPHASEHYGVYQTRLGWQSKVTKNWLQRSGALVDPHIQRMPEGRLWTRTADNHKFEPPCFSPAFLVSGVAAAALVVGSTVFTLLAL